MEADFLVWYRLKSCYLSDEYIDLVIFELRSVKRKYSIDSNTGNSGGEISDIAIVTVIIMLNRVSNTGWSCSSHFERFKIYTGD